MRRVLLAAAMFAMATHARAADMPDFLRGSVSDGYVAPMNWRGFYVGGQGAWASSTQTFTSATMDHSVFANLIAGRTISGFPGLTAPTPLGTASKGSAAYGAFTGYNWQWDDAVLGLEMSYLHGGIGGSVSAVQQFNAAQLSDGMYHQPRVTSTQAINVTDYATFRARAAYAYSCFLPYAFGGFALGYGDVTTSARIDDSVSATAAGPFTGVAPLIGSHAGENHVIYGYTAGLGIDINLAAGLFFRAEWEYVRFTQQIDTNVNSLRAGLGYKF